MSSAQLKSKFTFSQTGQGILEVIVTIAIGTILVLALVVLSVRSNRSSDFSKANSVASNLAAEGMEIIKNLKAINGVSAGAVSLFQLDSPCVGLGSARNWSGLFAIDIVDEACPSPGKIGYLSSVGCPASYNCVYFTGPTPEDKVIDNRTYRRTFYLADTPIASSGKSNCNTNADLVNGDWKTIKQFTVEVSFTDSSGTHKSSQSSCITR